MEEKLTDSRVLDEKGNPTEKIEDKSTYHLLDAERYLIADLKGAARTLRTDYVPGLNGDAPVPPAHPVRLRNPTVYTN